MNQPLEEIRSDMENLATDAGNLMDATASAAGQRYDEARKSLAAVLERGKDFYGLACRRAARDGRTADGLLHENLYQTVAVGIGIGMLLGYLVSRGPSRRGD